MGFLVTRGYAVAMLEYLEAKGIGPYKKLSLDLGERLNVITGDNGLGKTLLLDLVWWVCSRDWPEQVAIPNNFVLPLSERMAENEGGTHKIAGQITAKIVGRTKKEGVESAYTFEPALADWRRKGKSRPPIPGLVIYARIDGGFSVWDPTRHYYRVAPTRAIDDPDRPPAFHFSKSEVWGGKRIVDPLGKEATICEGLSRDWLTWETREPDRFQTFIDVLRHLSPPNEPIRPASTPVRLPGMDVSSMPALETIYGLVPLSQASAAIRRIIALAYFLVWTWREHQTQSKLISTPPENRIIIIIDEVDAHLHPKWQRLIAPSLLKVVSHINQSADVQLIISTHSPLVLASLEPEFNDTNDRLFHFYERHGEVVLDRRKWVKYGDVTGWLTSDVFSLAQARSRQAEEVIEAAEKFMRGDKTLATDLNNSEAIEMSLRAVLPSLDPIWARWEVFKRRQPREGITR